MAETRFKVTRASKRSYPPGYRTVNLVNIGYLPYVVRDIETVEVRTVPDDEIGFTIKTLGGGKRFGVQSAVNPDGSAFPNKQAPVLDRKGQFWVIGYSNTGGKTGWVRLDKIRPDTSGECWADGPTVLRIHPERRDFQVGCGKPRIKDVPRFVVGSKRDHEGVVRAQTAYVRWANMSTGRGYLHAGDRVKVLWTTPFGWSFVYIRTALDRNLVGKKAHMRTKDIAKLK